MTDSATVSFSGGTLINAVGLGAVTDNVTGRYSEMKWSVLCSLRSLSHADYSFPRDRVALSLGNSVLDPITLGRTNQMRSMVSEAVENGKQRRGLRCHFCPIN